MEIKIFISEKSIFFSLFLAVQRKNLKQTACLNTLKQPLYFLGSGLKSILFLLLSSIN